MNPPSTVESVAVNLKAAWNKFDLGEHLSDTELGFLIQNAKQGIAFLEARGENGGILFKARYNLGSLKDYQRNRIQRAKA